VAALGSEDDVALETERRRAAGIRPSHAGKPDPYLVDLVLAQTGTAGGAALFAAPRLACDTRCSGRFKSPSPNLAGYGQPTSRPAISA